jgi:nucleoside-diphosphate-sugar epimerase
MKVLVAGSTGALGVPLVRALTAGGHEVAGLTRNPANRDKLRALGARPLVADVLDRPGLLRAVDGLTADAVVHLATAFRDMPMRHHGMAASNALRTQGTANMLAAARAVGAGRFLAESMIFGYGYGDWGDRVLTEEDPPFGPPGRNAGLEAHLAAMRSSTRQTLGADGIEGVSLRYGGFYGPGVASGAIVELLRRRRLPVLHGAGVISLVWIDDAAAATVAALERGRAGQAYNVVDDEPVAWATFLRALAQAVGAPPPRELPAWLLRPANYAHAAFTTSMRVSGAKARRELGWTPSVPTWREGIPRIAAAQRAAA